MPNRFTQFLRTLVTLAGVAALHAGVARAAPPHVFLIVADDLGWMDLRCQGNERLNTPRLDALAKLKLPTAGADQPFGLRSRNATHDGLPTGA